MNLKFAVSNFVAVVVGFGVVVTYAATGGGGTPSGIGEETPATTEPVATQTATVPAPTPTGTVEPTATFEDGEGDGSRDITGIPDDNPNFVPDDDGSCERGESRVKTTPGENQVNVPCHAAENSEHAQDGHPGHEHGPPDNP